MAIPTLYESTTPGEGATALLMRVLAPDGVTTSALLWGGSQTVADLPSGTSYPAFCAGVTDANGRVWPVGDAVQTSIDFVDTDGACTLYLVPFGVTDAVPVGTRMGNFSLLAVLSASAAPPDSIVLGTGTVVGSAFTTYLNTIAVRTQTVPSDTGTFTFRNGVLVGFDPSAPIGMWDLSYWDSNARWA